MKKGQETSALSHASRMPVIRGGVASAPPSETGGKMSMEELGNYKTLQRKVHEEREELINSECGGIMK